jgi:hypothetical protein
MKAMSKTDERANSHTDSGKTTPTKKALGFLKVVVLGAPTTPFNRDPRNPEEAVVISE